MTEIEKKFLVISDVFKDEATTKKEILQGYLNSDPERAVRVRVKGDKAYITVKGISNESGMSRFEWEKEIDKKDAEALLKLCEPGAIEKIRYDVKLGKHTFEVDEFFGENEGLKLAEVELESEDEQFEKPDWLGEEVTGDKRYYNVQLVQNPYKNWNKESI